MGKFQHFLLIKNECCLNVLHFKGHIGKLCPAFYICIKYAENPFRKGLNKHASLLLGFELGNHVLGYLSGGSYEKDSPVQFKYSSRDLNKRVESVVFCLARCFFYILSQINILQKNKQNKNNNNQNNQEVLQIYQ